MRKLLMLCAALLVATPALAKDIIGGFYGHTMKLIGPTGSPHYFHYNSNFTFTEQVNGHAYSGYWRIRGYSICLTYNPPLNIALPEGRCVAIAANKIADVKVAAAVDTTPRPLLIHIIR
ncbi:MAG TPA: hypothetical protein VIJ62_02850 [Rhizomicrobium sp.]